MGEPVLSILTRAFTSYAWRQQLSHAPVFPHAHFGFASGHRFVFEADFVVKNIDIGLSFGQRIA